VLLGVRHRRFVPCRRESGRAGALPCQPFRSSSLAQIALIMWSFDVRSHEIGGTAAIVAEGCCGFLGVESGMPAAPLPLWCSLAGTLWSQGVVFDATEPAESDFSHPTGRGRVSLRARCSAVQYLRSAAIPIALRRLAWRWRRSPAHLENRRDIALRDASLAAALRASGRSGADTGCRSVRVAAWREL